jgi:hypothetical protein
MSTSLGQSGEGNPFGASTPRRRSSSCSYKARCRCPEKCATPDHPAVPAEFLGALDAFTDDADATETAESTTPPAPTTHPEPTSTTTDQPRRTVSLNTTQSPQKTLLGPFSTIHFHLSALSASRRRRFGDEFGELPSRVPDEVTQFSQRRVSSRGYRGNPLITPRSFGLYRAEAFPDDLICQTPREHVTSTSRGY